RAFFEWGDGGDERCDLNLAAADELDGLRVLAGRGGAALKADLARDDLLQRDGDFGRDVADQRDGAAFADRVDAGGDGLGGADGFEDDVDATAIGGAEDLGDEGSPGVGAGDVEGLVGAERAGAVEAGAVDVGDVDGRAAGDL